MKLNVPLLRLAGRDCHKGGLTQAHWESKNVVARDALPEHAPSSMQQAHPQHRCSLRKVADMNYWMMTDVRAIIYTTKVLQIVGGRWTGLIWVDFEVG
jgi:hypothetical protein